MNSSKNYESHAKLIAALAENINNIDYASDVIKKCSLMKEAIEKLEKIAKEKIRSEQ